ncbi:MAG: ribosome biogenesis GTP-binding protein YihA/YsxC [Spirochaetes bacterium]|nr:ribosome biogenesis GTP-binding protein YihA/YsxC [Spirochaetota bacterium]
MENLFKNVKLIKTVYKIEDFGEFKHKYDFLIFGRSNSGKSSFINSLINRKNFAFVSKKPGKTSSINFFLINNLFCLVDMPGYGYSKTSNLIKKNWNDILNFYFNNIKTIKYSFFLHDIRREFDELDFELINFLKFYKIPIFYIISKCDKETKSRLLIKEKHFLEILNVTNDNLILFSSLKKIGLNKVENIFKNIIF